MSLRLVIDPPAQEDLLAAASWYENASPGLGSAFLDETDRILARLIEAPLQFPIVHRDVRRGLTRRFPYGVYFTTHANTARVLAVLHLRRHPDTWIQRL